jgi:uncharacterized membrane protein YgcG
MSAAALLLGLSLPVALASAPTPLDADAEASPRRDESRELAGEHVGPLQAERWTTPGPAIINGESATADDYPETGGLIVKGTMDAGSWGEFPIPNMFICSSTLIAPDVVLTAAHCIDPEALTGGLAEMRDTEYHWSRQADLTAYNGSADIPPPDDGVAAWDWVMHGDWNMSGLGLGLNTNYDIALVFLAEPVLDVQPAILPTPAEGAMLETGLEVIAVGWGQQTATDFWETPPEGTIQLKQMGTSFIAEMHEAEFKVGEVESDVRKCHGDSGGPSFADLGEGELSMRLVGVTSHAYDESDCFETGGVDTRVDFYLDWIDAEMRSRCEDGSRAWCEQEGIVTAEYWASGGADGGDDGGGEDDGGDDGGGEDDGGGSGSIDEGSDENSVDDEASAEGGSEKDDAAGCSAGALAASGLPALLALGAVLRRRED